MTLTAARDTDRRDGLAVPTIYEYICATDILYEGGMAALNTAGRLEPAGASAGQTPVIGRIERTVDNSAGGTLTARVLPGQFVWTNSASSIDANDIGELCYAVDDESVHLSSDGDTRPIAGVITDVDGSCVTVQTIFHAAPAGAKIIKRTVQVTSADLTTAGVGPETENVGAVLPNTAVVIGYRINLVDAFDNGAGVSLDLEVGHSNDVDAYEDGFDVFTGSALEGAGWTYVTTGPGIGAPAWDGTAVGQCVAVFTAGGDQLANFTNGDVTIEVIAVDMAA